MCGGVAVEVEPAPSNGRCLFAGVDITAPPDVVWQALTDYDGLDSFIPGVREALRRAGLPASSRFPTRLSKNACRKWPVNPVPVFQELL